MRAFLRALLGFCLAAGSAAPAAAGVHERIYPAPTAPLAVEGLSAGAVLVVVRTADGLDLTGIAVPAREGMPTLLVLHGNGSSAADSVRWLEPLAARGYGIVAAEYRGYSGNPGRSDEAGLTADAEAFYALAKTRAGAGPVWVLGHSLGAGVAFDLARRERLDVLITVGAFTRLRAAAPKMARAFIPDAYRNLDAVPALDEPWFLVHGLADATVPRQEGEALHAAAGKAERAGASFAIIGAGHRPDGAPIAAIAESIRAWLETRRFDPSGLPPSVKLIPFGQSAPLNP